VTLPGAGYVLFRVEKVTRPTSTGANDPRLQAIKQQYSRLLAEQDFSAYVSALRKRYDVKVNAAMLEGAKDK
jgi:peptidyl-prolyl cis-trans isomerase D